MTKFGELEDCIVMKERSTGRSSGFGYLTFATVEDAKNASCNEHFLGNRILEEAMRAPSKKVTRILVARVPPSVTEATFRSGVVTAWGGGRQSRVDMRYRLY